MVRPLYEMKAKSFRTNGNAGGIYGINLLPEGEHPASSIAAAAPTEG